MVLTVTFGLIEGFSATPDNEAFPDILFFNVLKEEMSDTISKYGDD